MSQRFSLIENGVLRFDKVAALCRRPSYFEPGEAKFWNDPYIARQMLAIHLDPDIEAASRHPETIDKTVAWIIDVAGLKPGDALLDLGCGPGLYCKRFAARGLEVTGVDFSENSINYAREHDPDTTYICQDYTTLTLDRTFKTITLIFGDFCVLSNEKRDTLLDVIYGALEPGGCFVFDVMTLHHRTKRNPQPVWSASESAGFWKPGPHLTLSQIFDYPEYDTTLEQHIVTEADGATSVYRIWHHHYVPETITPILEAHGFTVDGYYGDLTGAPYEENSEWLGMVARK